MFLSGSGKTQLSMQLSCNVTLPSDRGGVAGECIYVDCEGNFCVERLKKFADTLVRHVRRVSEREGGGGELKGMMLMGFWGEFILLGFGVKRS